MSRYNSIWNNIDKRVPLGQGNRIKLMRQNVAREYVIDSERGRGASSIVYEAHYYEGERKYNCILKELYPLKLDEHIRRKGNALSVLSNLVDFEKSKTDFENGLNMQTILAAESGLVNSTINGFLLDGNNTLYIGMEYNEGTDFRWYLDTGWEDNQCYLCAVAKTLLALVKVIDKYHKKGLLLFDIKPENIFIVPETNELIKLFDCDSVFSLEDIIQNRENLSFTGEWSAPEIRNGQVGRISEATDFYAIGSMLFYAIFGRLPNVKESNELGRKWDTEKIKTFNPYDYDGLLVNELECLTNLLLQRKSIDISCLIEQLKRIIELANPMRPHVVNQFVEQNNDVRYKKEIKETIIHLKEHNLLLVEGVHASGKTDFIRVCLGQIANQFDVVQYLDAQNYQSLEETIVKGLEVVPELDTLESRKNFKRKCDLLKNGEGATLLVIDNLNIPTFDSMEKLEQILVDTKSKVKVIIVSNLWHKGLEIPRMLFSPTHHVELLLLFLHCMEKKPWETPKDAISIMEVLSLAEGYLPLGMLLISMINEELDFLEFDELSQKITLDEIKNTQMNIRNPRYFWTSEMDINRPLFYIKKLWNSFTLDNGMREILCILACVNYPIKRDMLVLLGNNKYEAQDSIDKLIQRFILIEDNNEIRLPAYVRNLILLVEDYQTYMNDTVEKLIMIITKKGDTGNEALLTNALRNGCENISLLHDATVYFIINGNFKGLNIIEECCNHICIKENIVEYLLIKGKISYYRGDNKAADLILRDLNEKRLSISMQIEVNILLGELAKALGRNDESMFYERLYKLLAVDTEFWGAGKSAINKRYETAESVLFRKTLACLARESVVSKKTSVFFAKEKISDGNWKRFDHPDNEQVTLELTNMLMIEGEKLYTQGVFEDALFHMAESVFRLKSCISKRGKNMNLAALNVLRHIESFDAIKRNQNVLDVYAKKQEEELLILYQKDSEIDFKGFLSDLYYEKGNKKFEDKRDINERMVLSFASQIIMIAKARGLISNIDQQQAMFSLVCCIAFFLTEEITNSSLLDFRKLLYTLNNLGQNSMFDVIMHHVIEEKPSFLVSVNLREFAKYYNEYKFSGDIKMISIIPTTSECLDILIGKDNVVNEAKYKYNDEIVELIKQIEPTIVTLWGREQYQYCQ